MKTIWYLDDDNIKHITVVNSEWEFNFFKNRFYYVGELKTA